MKEGEICGSRLVSDCHRRGWKAGCLRVEVGCRGFAGQSLCRAYTALDVTGVSRRTAIRNNTEAAEKASRWLWFKRADSWTNIAGAQAETSRPSAGPPERGCLMCERPTANDHRSITDDVPQLYIIRFKHLLSSSSSTTETDHNRLSAEIALFEYLIADHTD